MFRVHIDLPVHWLASGETLWAKALGNHLFRVQSVPLYAYGVNFHDVVFATRAGLKPVLDVHRVVQPSGHITVRAYFHNGCAEKQRLRILKSLARFKVGLQRANSYLYAIDVHPGGDFDGVCKTLEIRKQQGLLSFETCEARCDVAHIPHLTSPLTTIVHSIPSQATR